MALVLVVEDDLHIRVLYSRVLSRLDNVSVLAVGTLREAREIISLEPVSAVVLDLRLEDGSGLDLLQCFVDRSSFPLILIVSAFLTDVPGERWPHSSLVTMPKPADLDRLTDIVAQHVGRNSRPDPFSTAEYVQLACLGRHNVVLSLLGAETFGNITIRNGEVWSACWGRSTGVEAFTTAVQARGIRIEVLNLPEVLPPRQLAGGWQDLLIEAARLEDEGRWKPHDSLSSDELDFSDVFEEARRYSERPPALPEASQFVQVGDAHEPDHTALVEAGVRAVIARRYSEAVSLFERALTQAPTSLAIKHRLARLRQLGH